MLDCENQLQQEAVGMLGVNLVYGAFHLTDNPDEFIQSLADGIDIERIEIDVFDLTVRISKNSTIEFFALKLTQNRSHRCDYV